MFFWIFSGLSFTGSIYFWHALMTGNIPSQFHPVFGWLMIQAFSVAMVGISGFMQKEFANRVMVTLVSVLYIPLVILYFAVQYHFDGISDPLLKSPVSPRDAGLSDVYFSIITFTTTGYGDVTPGNFASRAVAALEALMGYGYGAFLIASFLDLLARARLKLEEKRRSELSPPSPGVDQQAKR